MCVYLHMEAEGQPWVSFLGSHSYFFSQSLSIRFRLDNSASLADQLATEPQRPTCLHSLSTGIISIHSHAWLFFLMDSEG